MYDVLNAWFNAITAIDYVLLPLLFLVLRGLREPDVPASVLLSRVMFVGACGVHHAVMATIQFTGADLAALRVVTNGIMAVVSTWAVVVHLLWHQVKPRQPTLAEIQTLHDQLEALR